ncbi:unnamed protein product, partial [Rotaria sp. Silwood2]
TINNSSPLTSPYRTNNQQTFFSSESTTTNISSNLEPQLISCSGEERFDDGGDERRT